MEVVHKHPLLQITKDDVEFTRKFYKANDVKRIKESIDTILEWMKKQDHLVESSKHISPDFIERIYILAQASTENAKNKIEKIFTMRGMVPEICMHRTQGEFDRLLSCVKFVPLPKLTPKEKSRVLVSKLISKNLDEFSLLDYCRYGTMLGEYRMFYEYNVGDRFIVDLNHMSIITKMNPVVMKKFDVLGEAYGSKVKGVHIVNAPQYVDTMVTLLKSVMREKVAGRLHVHSSYEDLHKYIDKKILPKDFGGDELSIEELSGKWQEHLKTPEAAKIIESLDKYVSDESRRSSATLKQDYLGMPGSFRKLNVD